MLGEQLRQKLQSTRELPTLPAVLMPLLRQLDQPIEEQDIHKIVRLISQDKSLAAQCLHLVNSPLFGCTREVESIQAAVVALGLERVRDIAVSCSILKLMPSLWYEIGPTAFWAHSLACALVAQDMASKIGFPDPAKSYSAGLLHDVGIAALLWVAPREFGNAMQCARTEHTALPEAELKILGLTHTEAGKIIAESWHLPHELIEAIAYHHAPERAPTSQGLAAIVYVSDLLCHLNGIGYGLYERLQTNLSEEPAMAILAKQCSGLRPFDWARFTFEMEAVVENVQAVVSSVYGSLK